ncbi:hypothetical protein KQX54_020363 [Cotesia glomerata]|uniref:Uncharacterized protein n=1 Tax=Cotesia glomerata TaxID=32391 RepID=A0AAV7IPN8_COTGL|nr:hypothetical protein KQX54_020363 [Cotesia glomerata]
MCKAGLNSWLTRAPDRHISINTPTLSTATTTTSTVTTTMVAEVSDNSNSSKRVPHRANNGVTPSRVLHGMEALFPKQGTILLHHQGTVVPEEINFTPEDAKLSTGIGSRDNSVWSQITPVDFNDYLTVNYEDYLALRVKVLAGGMEQLIRRVRGNQPENNRDRTEGLSKEYSSISRERINFPSITELNQLHLSQNQQQTGAREAPGTLLCEEGPAKMFYQSQGKLGNLIFPQDRMSLSRGEFPTACGRGRAHVRLDRRRESWVPWGTCLRGNTSTLPQRCIEEAGGQSCPDSETVKPQEKTKGWGDWAYKSKKRELPGRKSWNYPGYRTPSFTSCDSISMGVQGEEQAKTIIGSLP